MHRSPYFGQSVEFLQHRQYTAGDDLRNVDWKVWAKQDRLYVKQYEEDTNLRCTLLVDVSNSMQYGSGAMNKYDYACTIAASLAYLVLSQQDSVGCVSFDEVRATVPQRTKRNHLRFDRRSPRFQRGPRNKTDLYHDPPRRQPKPTPPRHDGADLRSAGRPRGTVQGLEAAWRSRGHDVLMFHILDDDELDFHFNGPTRFEGLETPYRLTCNPRALREGYLKAWAISGRGPPRVHRARADYALIRTSQPLDAALASYLNHRLAMNHGH